ncbi:MAG: LPS export ABC transporter permease LptG [Arenicella sp.]
MRILDRYIARHLLNQFAIVLGVLVSLFVFMTFIDELGKIDNGGYGIFQIVQYVILSIPKILYEIFPIAALIGAILGLSTMAKDSELVVMRSVGVSIRRIIFSTLKVGAILAAVAMVLGEIVAPITETKAIKIRAESIQKNVKQKSDFGLWMRDEKSFVNIGEVLPDLTLLNVKVFEFDKENQLRHLSNAKNGRYAEGKWILENIERTVINPEDAFSDRLKAAYWETKVSPAILKVFLIQPDQLSIWQLVRYIKHLNVNKQETKAYELSFWTKIVTPISTLVMLILAVPFVFRQVRSGALGRGLFSGIMLGLGFFILNKAFNYFVLLFNIPPFIGAIIPTLLIFVVSMALVKRVT